MIAIQVLVKDGMSYHIGKPHGHVSHFVDHYMVAEGFPSFNVERLFPNNEVELFFNLGDTNQGKIFGDKESFQFKHTILSGLRSTFLEVHPGKYFYIAGIRFSLFGFFHIFQIPTVELIDENMPADDVLGSAVKTIREKIGDLTDPSLIIETLDDWIRKKIGSMSSVYAWSRVDQFLRNPEKRIREDLPAFMGYSYKHSANLISRMCGLQPKMVQRIYRLKNLFASPDVLTAERWSSISYEFGFADQSHFIKELKIFTGYTPSQLISILPKDFVLKSLR